MFLLPLLRLPVPVIEIERYAVITHTMVYIALGCAIEGVLYSLALTYSVQCSGTPRGGPPTHVLPRTFILQPQHISSVPFAILLTYNIFLISLCNLCRL